MGYSKVKRMRSKTNCDVESAPALGPPRRFSTVLLLLASALLALSSSAGATPDDTDAMPIVLPIAGGVLMFLLAFIAVFMA